MTSRYDLLDQYIDARNAGRAIDLDEHPELRELVETIDQIKAADDIDWPEFDLPGEMSRRLQRQLDPASSTGPTSNGSLYAEPRAYPLVESGEVTETEEPEQAGWRWYSRQFAGMAAAALVVALFAAGLAYLYGSWGEEMHPVATVEPGEIPGTLLYVEYSGDYVDSGDDQIIARIDADGTGQQDLASRPSLRADTPGITWSPDGEWIGYFEPEQREQWSPSGITLVSADGSEVRELDGISVEGAMRLDTALNWSHDGGSLAFVHQDPETDQRRIGLVHLATGEFQSLEPEASEPQFNDSHPTWAPDRWALAFSRIDEEGHRGIYLLHGGMSEPISLVEGDPRAVQPAWSPDGESIAYIGGTEDEERGNVHVVDVSSGQTENISDHSRWDYLPNWSSRNQIAFMSDFGDMDYDIFLVDPDGANLRNITEDYDWTVYHPDWSDDGRYLTFTSHNQDQSRWRVNVYDVDEDRIYIVHESENPLYFAQWRPVQALEDPADDPDVEGDGISEEHLELMRRGVEQYLSEDDDPVAVTVNGEPITAGQIEIQQATSQMSRGTMQEMLEDADGMPPEFLEYNERFIELIDEYGPENVGLGVSLAQRAVSVYAEENDLDATDEQVNEALEHQRELHETFEELDPESAAAVREVLIDAIGEEHYWEVYLPATLASTITEQNVNQAVWEAADISPDENPTVTGLERESFLAEFRADLIREATIEVVDQSALGDAELDHAIEYIIEAYPALQRTRLDRVDELRQGQETGGPPAVPSDAVLQTEDDAEDAAREHARQEGREVDAIRMVDLMSARDAADQRGGLPSDLLENEVPIWRVEFFTEAGESVLYLNALDGSTIARSEIDQVEAR